MRCRSSIDSTGPGTSHRDGAGAVDGAAEEEMRTGDGLVVFEASEWVFVERIGPVPATHVDDVENSVEGKVAETGFVRSCWRNKRMATFVFSTLVERCAVRLTCSSCADHLRGVTGFDVAG